MAGKCATAQDAIERAVALSAGRSQIDVIDLPADIQQAQETVLSSPVLLPEGGTDLDAFVTNIERELIERSLERTGGNEGAGRTASRPQADDTRREAEALREYVINHERSRRQ